MPKVCPRNVQDMPKICPRYAQGMPKECPRYAQGRVAKCHGYSGYIRVKKLESWGKKSGRIHSFEKSSIVLGKFKQLTGLYDTTRIIWKNVQPLSPRSSLLCYFYSFLVLNLSRSSAFFWVKFGLEDLLCVKDLTFRNSILLVHFWCIYVLLSYLCNIWLFDVKAIYVSWLTHRPVYNCTFTREIKWQTTNYLTGIPAGPSH